MPYKVTKRGVVRYRARVTVCGVTREKLFPDAKLRSKHAAQAWENAMREQLTSILTRTDYLTVKDWASVYLNHCKAEFMPRTYVQKKNALKRMIKEMKITKAAAVTDITQPMAIQYLAKQKKARGPIAANYDRKNLSAAWNWGFRNVQNFPAEPSTHSWPS